MLNTTETNGAASVSAPAIKKKLQRSLFNQAQLRALAKADAVGVAAQKEALVSALEQREIMPTDVTALRSDVIAARAKARSAVDFTLVAQNSSKEEKIASKKLVTAMREIQKAAKQKFGRSNRTMLAQYLVGKKLNGTRPNLLQTSQSILDKVAEAPVPGFTAGKITTVQGLRTQWIAVNTGQEDAQRASMTLRAELKTLLKSIDQRRAAIQTAADAEWPHHNPENAGIRKDFALPINRPLPS